MKKILSAILLSAIMLTGCSSGSGTEAGVVEASEETSSSINEKSIYVEVYSQQLDPYSHNAKVFFNTVNGCLNEYTEISANKKGGTSWKEMLNKDGEPICGLSVEEARDMFRP